MSIRAHLPGLALASGLAALAFAAGTALPMVGVVTFAILFGAVWGNAVAPIASTAQGLRFADKTLLSLAVVGLGLEVDAQAIMQLGGETIPLITLLVAGTIGASLVASRILGLSAGLGLLIGVGSAVCGTAAIAAAAPLVQEDEAEVGVAVGVINALGTVGIFAVPALAVALGLGIEDSAVLIGGTLQAVGHVVAAGFTVGDAVGELAMVVKMGRVAMLVPVVMILGVAWGRRGGRLTIPLYLVGFLVAVALGTLGIIPASIARAASVLTEVALVLAMAAIGVRIRFADVLKQGPRAIVAGVVVFAIQIATVATAVSFLR